jgi:hypothetical protein
MMDNATKIVQRSAADMPHRDRDGVWVGRWHGRWADRLNWLGVAWIAACGLAVSAHASTPFEELAGAWRGQGQVQLASGKSEALTCKAYFNPKDGGSGLGIALACASASNKIDLRATLAQAGQAISGTWEERSFNSTGTVAGDFSNDRIELTIEGTIKATMSITLEGQSQLISIATDGTGFKSVDLELQRT